MPGNTTNTNLLDGVNQLILSINELVSATSAQTFDPTIHVAAPSVTVEASPIPPAPNVTVNFDTASIVAELSSIKDNAQNIATDTDNLANLLQIAGNSDHLTHLQQLPLLTTGLGTANTHFANIADRLAPDGKSIQPTLELLINALEASLSGIAEGVVDEFPTLDVTYAIPDPVKCLASKRAIGVTVKAFYYVKRYWALAKIAAVGEIALAALLSGGTASALLAGISAVAFQSAIDTMFTWSQDDINDFYTEYMEIAEDLVCAVYSSTNAEAAITAYTAVVDGQTWSLSESPGIVKLLIPVTHINKVFSNPSLLEPQYNYRSELGDWTNFDCATCAPYGDFSCFPQTGTWTYGSPSILSGTVWNIASYPVGTWATITSEWNGDNQQRIGIWENDDDYELEFEILSLPTGKDVRVLLRDCAENVLMDSTFDSIGLVASTPAATVLFHSEPVEPGVNPGTFQIRVRRIT